MELYWPSRRSGGGVSGTGPQTCCSCCWGPRVQVHDKQFGARAGRVDGAFRRRVDVPASQVNRFVVVVMCSRMTVKAGPVTAEWVFVCQVQSREQSFPIAPVVKVALDLFRIVAVVLACPSFWCLAQVSKSLQDKGWEGRRMRWCQQNRARNIALLSAGASPKLRLP